MSAFLDWFFAFITTMFSNIWTGLVSFFKGIIHIFDFNTYFGLFSLYESDFGAFGWILAVVSFILVYAFWACILCFIVLGIRKICRYRRTLKGNEDLLEEIAQLQRELARSNEKKDRLLNMSASMASAPAGNVSGFTDVGYDIVPGLDVGSTTIIENKNNTVASDAEDLKPREPRFYRLTAVDEKYSTFVFQPFEDGEMTLADISDEIRNYACSQAHLYYEKKTIRLMLAGMASTKLILLQGISGTGKTSLPYVIGKYLANDATIASVQPSWRDRTELFGFFNEFTKKFNETEVLRRIYESSYTDDINLIVLDELNISRVEYYFAEMLSVLEMPDPEEWRIQIVSSMWENDPMHLENGNLKIPQNVWYVGTANNDDSTFAVSDKVYDRALVINLDNKGVPFDAPMTLSRRVSYAHLTELFKKAQEENPVSREILDNIEKLDNYVIEKFRVAFGNRIMKQIKTFVPVFVACGGSDLEAVDYLLATKVFRKFEGLNLSLIRDEINGLVTCLDNLFGHDMMHESITFLRRLQKSY